MRCFITGHVVHDGMPLDNERSIELSDEHAERLVALGVARIDTEGSDVPAEPTGSMARTDKPKK